MNWLKYIGVVILALFLLTPQAVFANVRLDNGGRVPYYARLERSAIYADGDWVAIAFYYQPSCIPTGFNLLDFFDFNISKDCQPTTTGFEIWKNGPPPIDMAPIQQEGFGMGAVPVWFVDRQELSAAIEDNQLTIGELASLPSLKIGSASFFHMTLHPYGGAVRDHIVFDAHGSFEDGNKFTVHAEVTNANFIVSIRVK